MELSHADRRLATDRRAPTDRRRVVTVVVEERRSGIERRAQPERRSPESAGEHIRNAVQLLTNVAESGTLDEESLRDLDAAMFRLRFALDRLEARGEIRGLGAGARRPFRRALQDVLHLPPQRV